VDGIFFIGLQEAYSLSLEVMFRELGVNLQLPAKREREQVSKKTEMLKKAITGNATLMQRAREVNSYDYKLYELGEWPESVGRRDALSSQKQRCQVLCVL
jgi:hypothetical protein